MARLSASGRYALAGSSAVAESIGSVVRLPSDWWLDLLTGQTERYGGGLVPGGAHPIADDGSVFRYIGEPSIWRPAIGPFVPERRQRVPPTFLWEGTLLSRDGRLLIGQQPFFRGLVSVDVAAGTTTTLTTGLKDTAAEISGDGSAVLISGDGQLRVVKSDGSSLALPSLPGPVKEATLSGDGRVVFAVLEDGRIVRAEVGTNVLGEVAPAAGVQVLDVKAPETLYFRQRQVAPGELVRVGWSGAPPIAIRFGAEEWEVLGVADGALYMRVPADARLDAVGRDLQFWLASSGGLFQPMFVSTPWRVVERAPLLFGVYRQDWSAAVTMASPAAPGEAVHVYGTGFGAGVPRCVLRNSEATTEAELLYSGEAPGSWPGMTQSDVRIPASLAAGSWELECGIDGITAGVGLVVGPAVK